MQTAAVLSVIGGILSVFLAVNAYFIRELVRSIQGVEVSVAALTEKSKSAHLRIDEIDGEIKTIREKFHSIGNTITKVELKTALLERDVQHATVSKT